MLTWAFPVLFTFFKILILGWGWWFYVNPEVQCRFTSLDCSGGDSPAALKRTKESAFCLERNAKREELDSCRQLILFLYCVFWHNDCVLARLPAGCGNLVKLSLFAKQYVWLIWCCIEEHSLSANRLSTIISIDWAYYNTHYSLQVSKLFISFYSNMFNSLLIHAYHPRASLCLQAAASVCQRFCQTSGPDWWSASSLW